MKPNEWKGKIIWFAYGLLLERDCKNDLTTGICRANLMSKRYDIKFEEVVCLAFFMSTVHQNTRLQGGGDLD